MRDRRRDASTGDARSECLGINDRAFAYYPRLAKVRRFVEEHYREPVTLETAAKVAGLEKTYFCRFFHQKTGVRYKQWLNWVRVQHAVNLMTERRRAITRLAFRVGFRDLRTFERAFHEHTGLTPSEMQRRLERELA